MNTRVAMNEEMMEMVNGGMFYLKTYKTAVDVVEERNSEKKEETEMHLEFYEF